MVKEKSGVAFPTYQSTLFHLWKTAHPGIRLDLFPVRNVLSRLGNPQSAFPSVLVAGTNGKGSASAILSEILAKSGLCVGHYTSPHLSFYHERIAVKTAGGQSRIPESIWRESYGETAAAIASADVSLTQFEILTALSFVIFKKTKTDIAILEVGLGGRLDATNVVEPVISVIAPVDLDHRNFLGDTVEKIAMEKAAIMRPGICAVSIDQRIEARRALEIAAERLGSVLRFVSPGQLLAFSIEAQCFEYRGKIYTQKLLGAHQVGNACLAIEAALSLRESGFAIPDAAISGGVAEARWPARFEVMRKDPPVILDCAHNPHGAESLVETLHRARFPAPHIFVVGILDDKDAAEILKTFSSWGDRWIFCRSKSPRSIPESKLAEIARNLGLGPVKTAEGVGEGIRQAMAIQGNGSVCAAGSLTVAGEARRILGRLLRP